MGFAIVYGYKTKNKEEKNDVCKQSFFFKKENGRWRDEDVDAENSRYTGNQESREEKIRLGTLVNKIIARSSSYAQEW